MNQEKIRFFLDFDGTISTTDVVDKVLERFARNQWRDVEKDWRDGRIGSKECLSRQIDFVVAQEKDLLELAGEIEVDPFFVSFLEEAKALSAPVSIVSDGFDMFIEPILQRALGKTPELLASLSVYCNELYWTGRGLKAIFKTQSCAHGCANCKPAWIKKTSLSGEKIIFVGDGLSDRFAVKESHIVFAKGALADYCQANEIPHSKFSTFREITDWLAESRSNIGQISKMSNV